MEIPSCAENDRLARFDVLGGRLICPLPRHLDGGLDRLGTGVHRENAIVAKRFLHLLRKARKDRIIECT